MKTLGIDELAYRKAANGQRGVPDAIVPSKPFIDWLLHTDRSGWTARLDESQQRYVERVLKERPEFVNVHSVDQLVCQLDRHQLLNLLYPN